MLRIIPAFATVLLLVSGCAGGIVEHEDSGTQDGDSGIGDGDSGNPDACTPNTCDSLGVECGQRDDGCGGVISCGICAEGWHCDNGKCFEGTCTPETCRSLGKQCGQWPDGCGDTLSCGGCDPGWHCEGGTCVEDGCTPETCQTLGKECGQWPDGCGDTLSCGGCPSGQTCDPNGSCVSQLPSPTWLLAMSKGSGRIYLGWRMVSTHPNLGYNVYRSTAAGGPYTKINSGPILDSTNFLDTTVSDGTRYYYVVRLVDGGDESPNSNQTSVTAAGTTSLRYRTIPNVFQVNDYGNFKWARYGDVDGDRLMDFVVTGRPYLSELSRETIKAYSHDGSLLWSMENGLLGQDGPEPTRDYKWAPWYPWDLDGDGKGEIIGFRKDNAGVQYLTVRNGEDGTLVREIPYPHRLRDASPSIGYLDGINPHIVTQEGITSIENNVARAYDANLDLVWEHIRPPCPDPCNNVAECKVINQGGGHGLVISDFTGDGKDEVFYGSLLLRGDGTEIWQAPTTGGIILPLFHPDGICPYDIDPTSPGKEVLYASCASCGGWGLKLINHNGVALWQNYGYGRHAHQGFVADICSNHSGMEIMVRYKTTGGGMTDKVLFNSNGVAILEEVGDLMKSVRWDADEYQEVLMYPGTVMRWNGSSFQQVLTLPNGYLNGGTAADVIGDYREELMVLSPQGANMSLMVYTNTDLNSSKEPSPWEERNYALHQHQHDYWNAD